VYVVDEQISFQPELVADTLVRVGHFFDGALDIVGGVYRLVYAGVPATPDHPLDAIPAIQQGTARECLLLDWLWHVALLLSLAIHWLSASSPLAPRRDKNARK
jgi:hypothetical protein